MTMTQYRLSTPLPRDFDTVDAFVRARCLEALDQTDLELHGARRAIKALSVTAARINAHAFALWAVTETQATIDGSAPEPQVTDLWDTLVGIASHWSDHPDHQGVNWLPLKGGTRAPLSAAYFTNSHWLGTA